jgi:hypothetical protein
MSGHVGRSSFRRHRVPRFRKDVKAVLRGEENGTHNAQRFAERRPMITTRWSSRKLNRIPGPPLIDRNSDHGFRGRDSSCGPAPPRSAPRRRAAANRMRRCPSRMRRQAGRPATRMCPLRFRRSRRALAVASARSLAADSPRTQCPPLADCYCLLRFANLLSKKPNRVDDGAEFDRIHSRQRAWRRAGREIGSRTIEGGPGSSQAECCGQDADRARQRCE